MYTFKLIEKIWQNLSFKHKKVLLLLMLFNLFVALLELGVAAIISLLGITLTSPQEIHTLPIVSTLYSSNFIQSIPLEESVKPLLLVLLIMVLLITVKNAYAALLFFKSEEFSQKISWSFAKKLFHNYLHASYTWHSQRNSAHLQTNLAWRSSVGMYCSFLLNIFSQIFVALVLMGGAFYMAPFEMFIFFSMAIACSGGVYLFTKQKATRCGNAIKQINLGANKLSLSALHGVKEVQIYNQYTAFKESFAAFSKPAIYNTARLHAYPNIPSWALESVGMILLFVVVLIMYYSGDSITHIAGTLAMLVAVSWRLLPAMNRVLSSVLQLKLYFPQAESVVNDLHIQNTLPTVPRVPFAQALQVQHISFTYPKNTEPTLKDINFSLNKGQMVGFIGVSGAGKSTLIAILTGLLPPTQGELWVDGQKVALGPGYLKVGYVSQSPYLIDASLAVNVAFSHFDELPDEERVLQCCQAAAMDFIDDLPQGIHTPLGERGVRLSGGQIQRVAIARALYSKPDILIFDEATSALDGAAEAAIQKTILSLHKDMTIVMIAHRLSTVEDCDTIHWLKDGSIYRSGSANSIIAEYSDFLQQHQEK